MTGDRLYGGRHDETLYLDIAEYVECETWLPFDYEVGDKMPPGVRVEIVEFSVMPPRAHMPDLDSWLERLTEWIAEDGLVDEDGYDHWANALGDDVRSAFDAAFELWASKVTYRMADHEVASHWLTFDENDEPLVDGEPLYVKREEI